MNKGTLYSSINKLVSTLDASSIPASRRDQLLPIIQYLKDSIAQKNTPALNFICTHNSRRSQFSQIWAATLAHHFDIEIVSFSGGVEVTECNIRTIESLKRFGFEIVKEGNRNPVYLASYSNGAPALPLFSKLYGATANSSSNFAAVMTCNHADVHCPIVEGAQKRISLPFLDPKEFDDTDLQNDKYDERSLNIATELFYVLSHI